MDIRTDKQMKTKVRGFVFINVQRILAHVERFSDTCNTQGDINEVIVYRVIMYANPLLIV